MSDMLWGGLDIGDYTTQICVTDNDGLPVFEQLCKTSPDLIRLALEPFGPYRFGKIAMEAMDAANDIARHLIDESYPVALYDARRMNRYLSATPNKTDRNDARGIALAARLGKSGLREVHIKSRDIQDLRGELVMRDSMVRQRVAVEGIFKTALRVRGIKLGTITTAKRLREKAAEARETLGPDMKERLMPVVSLCDSLRTYTAYQDRVLSRRAEEIEVVRRFMEIPCVGTITALSFYTAIEDPHRFGRISDVGAYLGLVPKVSQSGKSLRMGRISRFGSTMTRAHLVIAARSLLRKSTTTQCDLRVWGDVVAERASLSKARVAVARKLAVIMLAMWRSGSPFRPNAAV